jgi:hypothetical protein
MAREYLASISQDEETIFITFSREEIDKRLFAFEVVRLSRRLEEAETVIRTNAAYCSPSAGKYLEKYREKR